MPISVTGSKRNAREDGFTLIELLVVLVLMGLLSAAVVVALPDLRGSVTMDAERMAARIKAAQDKAILDGRAVTFRIAQGGYVFERRQDGEWRSIASYDLPQGTEARADSGERLVLDPTGLGEPATITLSRDGAQAAVTLDGGGAVRVTT